MITADQASIFPHQFFVATSSGVNGVIRHPSKDKDASQCITEWCRALQVPLESTVGLYITYGNQHSYTDIAAVDTVLDPLGASTERGWIAADALVTTAPGVAMILPVADCNAVVYADPVHNVLALAHLGRHATVRNLAAKLVAYLQHHYGTQPSDILVYNSPSIRPESYHFDHLEQTEPTHWHHEPYATLQPDGTYAVDLVRYNYDQWLAAGITPDHIQIANVDTAKSPAYPSHFAGDTSRFAVLAMIKDHLTER